VAQFQVECIESFIDDDFGQYGKFVLEPLERGQGITVGNALRRVLLSNLSGTAITAVRIAGVSHEFSTIPGVREDVLDILLNVKQVVLKGHTQDTQIGRLHVQGPSTVNAADIELSTDVEVINIGQYIATLATDANLEMEFRIEHGKGYRPVEKNRDDSASLDFMQIDAVFMPVRKVNYSVEDARVGGALEKDRLILEVWTDGSINPLEALDQASSILVDLFSPLRGVTFEKEDEARPDTDGAGVDLVPIENLNLSVRAYNCLKRAQINNVSDLVGFSQEDLLEIKNFGAKSAEEVIEALQTHLGITLPLEKASKPSP
jgi:DNA-directed RNA polymerase subunit alpha